MITKDQITTLLDLQALGYAIVIFTPEELGGVNPTRVEGAMIDCGWATIEALASYNAAIDKVHQDLEQSEAYGV